MTNAIPFLAGLVVGAAGAVLLCIMLFYVALHYKDTEDWHEENEDY